MDDTATSTQRSLPGIRPMQLPAAPDNNNLFELLIKRAELSSSGTMIPREKPASKHIEKHVVQAPQQAQLEHMERIHYVNGHSNVVTTNNNNNIVSLNGRANAQENEVSSSDIVSNNNQSPRRSIFDTLHKNYQLYEEPKPTKTDVISTIVEPVSMETNQVEGVRTMYEPSNGHVIFMNDADNGRTQSTGREGSHVLPFTHRLKRMTTQSRDSSASLLQQLPTDQPSSYHGNRIATSQISAKPVLVDKPAYTPVFGQTVASGSGPVSLHLHNGGIGNLALSRNDVYLVLDSHTKFVGKGNYSEPTHTGHYIQPAEQYPTSQQTSYSLASSYSHETMQTYPQAYSSSAISTNHNARYNTSSHTRREGHPFYSQPPPYSPPPYSSHWESRPSQSIMTSPIHRRSGSSRFSYTNETSAFVSTAPAVSYQSQRSPARVESHNGQRLNPPRYQANSLEPRTKDELRVTNPHHYSPSVNIRQQTLHQHATSNDSFPKVSDHLTISDRLFRPVSPTWNQELYSNKLDVSKNNANGSSLSDPSEADKDAFSYACALHESANSPDIERMLGAESPTERTSITSPPPTVESPNDKTEERFTPPESPDSDVIRETSSFSDSSPTIKSHSVEQRQSLDTKSSDESSQSSDINPPTSDSIKKRKLSLNVIHKRLEPKLPSPVREVTAGDLFQDPSKLTREERALQRAMMMFSEMEMKEKVVKKKKEVKAEEPKKTTVQTKGKASTDKTTGNGGEKRLASSAWLLNVKRKRKKLLNKSTNPIKNESVPVSDKVVTVEPLVDHQLKTDGSTDDSKEMKIKTKIKKRRLNKDDGKIGNLMIKKKKKKKVKYMNEEKTPVNKDVKATVHHAVTSKDFSKLETTEVTLEAQRNQKKLKVKRKQEDEKPKKVKHFKKSNSNVALPTDEKAPSQPSPVEKRRNTDEKHIVKTYMLVPSYQGFKDFQPVVIESRTRRKGAPKQEQPAKVDTKPKIPLLVVESVHSKPVKEMIVAENEQVQKLVTECLRIQGKWHGDELERALTDEEELNEEVKKLRDAKKLAVNRTTGETILHKAARLGYDEIVKQCILQGADPNAKDNAGWTPLHEACARGKHAVVKVLLRYGADVNSQSNDGIRPIHDAAEAGHVNVIRVLLSYGADPFLVTYAGLNAMACAKHPVIKAYLQEYCADVGHPVPNVPPNSEQMDGWELSGSSTDVNHEREAGIWTDIPDCTQSFFPEFEVCNKPHINTYNLPVIKDDVIVGRRNYMLVQELYENSNVAKTTLQKKLKSVEMLELPWSTFLKYLSENQICVKPSCTPEGTSSDEPVAQLVPLNYGMRRLLNIRIESTRFL